MVRLGLVALALTVTASMAGDVKWERSYSDALKIGEKTERPIAIVFGIDNKGGTC
jgi:hypothetical protein